LPSVGLSPEALASIASGAAFAAAAT